MKPFIKGFLLVVGAAPLQAEQLAGSWYWHAFASQGAVHTSDNNFFGESDDGVSGEFRELGAILGGRPLEGLHVAGQVLSRQLGEIDETDFQVDYAFASYSPYSTLDAELGAKVGRIRAPIGFYNETRDVAHTRPGILLPQSIYPERYRNIYFARDGAHLFGRYQHGLSSLSWDLSYGKLGLGEDEYPELIDLNELPGDIHLPSTPVARVIWDWDMGRVRLGATYLDFSGQYRAAVGDYIPDADASLVRWIFSAEYNAIDWSLIAEYTSSKSDVEFPSARYVSKGYGYYVQGVYRFNPTWDAFVRWDAMYGDRDMRDNPLVYSKDVAIGLGWRPDSNWLLRAEWHVTDGLATLSARENSPGDLQQHWQMVLFQVSYRL